MTARDRSSPAVTVTVSNSAGGARPHGGSSSPPAEIRPALLNLSTVNAANLQNPILPPSTLNSPFNSHSASKNDEKRIQLVRLIRKHDRKVGISVEFLMLVTK